MCAQVKDTVIFYYSQSGNSLDAARRLARGLEESPVSTSSGVELISIPRVVYNNQFQFSGYERVGFVFPLYFMGMPRTVATFLEQLQLADQPYTFGVVTQALTHGNVLAKLDEVLSQKGMGLDYGAYVTYPDSYIRWMEGPTEEKEKEMLSAAEEILPEIAEDLAFMRRQKAQEGLAARMLAKVVYPIWRGTLKGKGRLFQVGENCIQCGICKRTCPAQNIRLQSNGPVWSDQCEDCMACVQHCPVKAISLNSRTEGKRRYRNPHVDLADLLL